MTRATLTVKCNDGIIYLADLVLATGRTLLFRDGAGEVQATIADTIITECPHCGKSFRGIRVDLIEETDA